MRVCTVCGHKRRRTIDREIVASVPDRAIAGRFGLSRAAVQRHSQAHLSPRLLRALEAKQGLEIESLVEELVELKDTARDWVDDEALTQGQRNAALMSARATIETIGKFRGVGVEAPAALPDPGRLMMLAFIREVVQDPAAFAAARKLQRITDEAATRIAPKVAG
jgi:hypothetical protein